MLITIIVAVVAFGLGFVVGNRSARGEGAKALAVLQDEINKYKTKV